MVHYIEIHISKKNLERLIFLGIILILLVVAVLSFKIHPKCPEAKCDQKTTKTTKTAAAAAPEQNTIPTPEEPKEQTIFYADIENMNFAPKVLDISKGSTVIFTNQEKSTAHKIYETKGLFYSPRMNPGDAYNFTFANSGDYIIWSIMGLDKGTKMEIKVLS